ncbi:MAG: class I SAM-dependent methyltransferase, partial [Gemmatimonadales bacterium]|jgi:hypothetical protein
MTGYLQVMIERLRLYDAAAPVIAHLLKDTGGRQIVDLCSGSGGPWPGLLARIAADGVDAHIVLTDLVPAHHDPAGLDGHPAITYHPASVSALDVPAELPGLRTMFTALHHFGPEQVREIFVAAQRDNVPFAAFEATARSLRGLLTVMAVPLLVLWLMPRVESAHPLALLLTYLPPILPLMIGWDGVASTFRSHTEDELRELVDGISEPGYRWTVRRQGVRGLPVKVLQVVGQPKRAAVDIEGKGRSS